MSAFIVSKEHIDVLVDGALRPQYAGDRGLSWYHEGERHQLSLNNADQVGAMLWTENIRSVEHRYSPPGREAIYGEGWETPDRSLPGTYQLEIVAQGVEPIETPEWSTEYRYPIMRVRQRTPVEVLKLIQCFEYQSCEHDDWEASEAKAFCDSLTSKMIGMLPGYDDAKWGI